MSDGLVSAYLDDLVDLVLRYHAQLSLDELERLLDAGAPDAVRPALEKLTTRLRGILEHADDSSGVIGDDGQRGVELYARSCREGSPKAQALARWLITFGRTSPGWPTVDLAMVADAFNGNGATLVTVCLAEAAWTPRGTRPTGSVRVTPGGP